MVEFVDNFKFLGIFIDNKLSFSRHVELVIMKLTSANFIIGKCRQFLALQTRLLHFNAIRMLHINYGAVCYLHGCNKKLFNALESRYIDCGRIIIFNRKGSSRSHTLLTLGWLPLLHHKVLLLSKYVHTILQINCPTMLSGCFTVPQHCHNTRHSESGFIIPTIYKKLGTKAFGFWGPYLWNSLPLSVKIISSPTACEKAIIFILFILHFISSFNSIFLINISSNPYLSFYLILTAKIFAPI